MPSIINATTTNGLSTSADNSGSLQLATNNGTTAVTIDTSQNVGIGTTSPAFPLDVAGAMRGNSWIGRTNVSAPTADAAMYRAADNTLAFSTANTERMRITSSGNLLVGGTTQYGSSVMNITTPNFDSGNQTRWGYALGQVSDSRFSYWNHQTDSGGNAAVFYTASSGLNLGIVMVSNTNGVRLAQGGTSWSSYSDERLKNVTGEITNALDKVAQIRAVEYSWKSDESNTKRVGVIAQDLQKVLPEVVDADTEYLQVRYSEMIPLCLKAIQELNAKVEAQAVRIAELEGAK